MELTHQQHDEIKSIEFDITRMERLKIDKANEPKVVSELNTAIFDKKTEIELIKAGLKEPLPREKPSRPIEIDTFDIDAHIRDLDFSQINNN